jgi:putative ABC transport system ATP-binding protein
VNAIANPIVQAAGLRKQYGQGKGIRAALDGVSLEVARGDFLAIVGPSGCGKSTLLGILGGLDRSFQGELELFGADTRKLGDRDLAELRGKRMGFVFQAFHLLGHLSALENVLAPGLFSRAKLDRAARARLAARAEKLLGDLGLGGRGSDMPAQLSGGERQRVAIARAMLMEPELLLCDEPTGNLDAHTGKQIVEVFRELHHRTGITVVGVTHDELLTQVATRIIRLRHGRLVEAEQEGASAFGHDPPPPSEAGAKAALDGEDASEAALVDALGSEVR